MFRISFSIGLFGKIEVEAVPLFIIDYFIVYF